MLYAYRKHLLFFHMLFRKETHGHTLVQLQIIHFLDLQSTVPLTRGPSVTAEPLVYTYVSWDMPYISRVQNFKTQASCTYRREKASRHHLWMQSHDLDHIYIISQYVHLMFVKQVSNKVLGTASVVQHYMEHEMYNLPVNLCLFSRYGR